MERTPFERDLEVYFPDIYKLHLAGKADTKVWTAVYEMLMMIQNAHYGEIKITFQKGRINHVMTGTTK